jgi:hypothetical protein
VALKRVPEQAPKFRRVAGAEVIAPGPDSPPAVLGFFRIRDLLFAVIFVYLSQDPKSGIFSTALFGLNKQKVCSMGNLICQRMNMNVKIADMSLMFFRT